MKIRTRLLLAFVLFVVTGVFGLVYWVADEIRPRYLEAQEEILVDLAELMASLVSEHSLSLMDDSSVAIAPGLLESIISTLPDRTLKSQIYGLTKQQVDVRFYLTDRAGTVIFDSDKQRDLHADYSQWRDVALTLRGEYGARTTAGDPIYPAGDTMYIARPILYQGDVIGVLSVGKPTRNVDAFILSLRDNLLIAAFAIAVTTALVGLLLNLWLTRPLLRLRQYAQDVGLRERTAAPDLGQNEVGDVARALDAMRSALDGKSYVAEYVQSLTHELKAPVSGIRGAAELLQEPMSADHQRKFLHNIVGQTERIQTLIERLLDLAALENRPALDTMEAIDIQTLINDVIHSESDAAHSHQLALQTDISGSPTVKGDAFLLRQALVNLVKNAIEHSPDGGDITISAAQSDAGVKIAVSDHGTGIPAYAMEKILNRFYSLPKPSGQKGSGLGLAFVKEIVALHDGQISIMKNQPSGTCIVLSIPA